MTKIRPIALPLLLLGLLLAACTPAPGEVIAPAAGAAPSATPAATRTPPPTPTPFTLSAEGNFIGEGREFILPEDELLGLYAPVDEGLELSNQRLLDLRPDGEAYLQATGRQSGWQATYQRIQEADAPPLLISIVVLYEDANGPATAVSREWHMDVWSRIDSGELQRLPDIPGLEIPHLVFQNAEGTVGVEMLYRNLYVFLTASSDGGDSYEFLARLAKAHLAWIQSREP